MANGHQILQSLSTLHKGVDSLNQVFLYVENDVCYLKNGLDSLRTNVNFMGDSISCLIKNSVPIGWQISSVIVSFLSILITVFTCLYVRKIKVSIKVGNNLAEIRKALVLLKSTFEKTQGNRPVATNNFKHFQTIVGKIPDYMKDYDENGTLKKIVDEVKQAQTMNLRDVRLNINLILNEIGEMYAS